METNKKIIIIGIISLTLLIIISILIAVLNSKNEKKTIQFSMDNKVENQTTPVEPEKPENTTKNETEKPKTKIEGEITYIETTDGGKIPVPPTFEYVEGDSNTGAIIQDKNENQFVWIPINETNTYQRQIFVNNGDGITPEDIEELNINDINSYNQEYNDSILNYGGFYVARFEAGKEAGEERPSSKKGILPWTQIVWQKAKDLSMNMYDTNDYFQTDLINSYAWDSICNWMRNTEINIDDSTSYGNYQNSSDGLNRVLETGSNERWKANNIYDMAGNAWEYTTEEYGSHEKYHIGRGGGYWNYGNLYPISTRGTSEDSSDLNIGFRVVMYLK